MLVAAPAAAAENRFERALQMLAPDERLEQLCDSTAMTCIRKETGNFRPDRAVANATAEPRIRDHTIEADGGAFHSRGKWYALSLRQMVRAFVHLQGDARSHGRGLVSLHDRAGDSGSQMGFRPLAMTRKTTKTDLGVSGRTDLEEKGGDDRGALLEACELQPRRRERDPAIGNAIRHHYRARHRRAGDAVDLRLNPPFAGGSDWWR